MYFSEEDRLSNMLRKIERQGALEAKKRLVAESNSRNSWRRFRRLLKEWNAKQTRRAA
jgi:hypothetical protein